jgi:hypothetical protein
VRYDHVPELDLVSLFAARAAWHARLDRAWRLAADRGLVVPSSVDRPQAAGRSMADLPNPFAPLVEVWATGYAFADVTGDAIHLIAPADDRGGRPGQRARHWQPSAETYTRTPEIDSGE